MAASTNKRIFYAAKQLALRPDATAGSAQVVVHGAQSASLSTNFNLDQVFELGQISIYNNIEDIPDVEISVTKVLDGYPPAYLIATKNASGPTLAGRSNDKVIATIGFFSDTANSAAGNALSAVEASGMYIGSFGYNFPVDDNFTEDFTLVGNDCVWKNDAKILNSTVLARSQQIVSTGFFTAGDDAPLASGGVNRRKHLSFAITITGTGSNMLDSNSMAADPDATILPPEVFGISSSGSNNKSNGQDFDAHIQRISCSTDLGREAINELGRFAPYHRYATFPVEVTSEVEVVTTSGSMVSATEEGILTTGGICGNAGNLRDRTIRIATCEGLRVYLGKKNKLASIQMGGGDAGGGNETCTYSFTNFNDFTVLHINDPHASGATWWANRSTYLT